MGNSTALHGVSDHPVIGAAVTRRTSLVLPPGFSLAEWKRVGKHLFLIADSSCWWHGDWLVYGQERYPGKYRRAMEETGLDYKTLRNYAWIARRFPASERNPRLSFQHHAEVASLAPEERRSWLDRAAQEGWSRNRLRHELRKGLSDSSDVREPRQVRLQLRTTTEQESAWTRAAERDGLELAEWITASLDRAAGLDDEAGP